MRIVYTRMEDLIRDEEKPSFRNQASDPRGNKSKKSITSTYGTKANHVPVKEFQCFLMSKMKINENL